MSSISLADNEERPNEDILYMGFNQDHQCLAVGITKGFRIFNCDPYKQTYKRDFGGGLGIVEMLFRCNIVALVGGGENSHWDAKKIVLWDDNQKQAIGELSFKEEVRAVKLRKDKIIVALKDMVHVYNFEKLERTHRFDTCENPEGVVAVSPLDNCIIAFPGTKKGTVRVENLDTHKSRTIDCHENEIGQIAISSDGSKMGTCSNKGTLVRIFDLTDGEKLKEVRRGSEKAEIYCISFNKDATMICTCSDKGTVHVFSILEDDPQETEKEGDGDPEKKSPETPTKKKKKGLVNRKSKLHMLGKAVPYLKSEWSFAWFKGPECPSICCFGANDEHILLMTSQGLFYKLKINMEKNGQMKEVKAIRFIQNKK